MENLLFAFNIIFIVLFTISISGFYALYIKNKKNSYKYVALLFVLLIIENSIVYMSEFSISFDNLYESSTLLYIIMYSIFIAIAVVSRLITSYIYHDEFSSFEKKFNVFLILIIFIIYTFIPFELSELIIYSYFYLALLYISIRAFRSIKKLEFKPSKHLDKVTLVFTMLTALACFSGLVESILYYASYNDPISTSSSVLSLDYRNLSFDFIKFISSLLAIYYLKYSLDKTHDEKQTSDEFEIINKSTNQEKLSIFSDNYSITVRQMEIIKLMVEGYSNKEISDRLFITEGTVKTHIYNIYKKVEVSSRTQLLNKILKD